MLTACGAALCYSGAAAVGAQRGWAHRRQGRWATRCGADDVELATAVGAGAVLLASTSTRLLVVVALASTSTGTAVLVLPVVQYGTSTQLKFTNSQSHTTGGVANRCVSR
jgi:hypothetical protein